MNIHVKHYYTYVYHALIILYLWSQEIWWSHDELVVTMERERLSLLVGKPSWASISWVRSRQLRDPYLRCLFLLHLKDELIISEVARDIRSVTAAYTPTTRSAHTISTRDFGSAILGTSLNWNCFLLGTNLWSTYLCIKKGTHLFSKGYSLLFSIFYT